MSPAVYLQPRNSSSAAVRRTCDDRQSPITWSSGKIRRRLSFRESEIRKDRRDDSGNCPDNSGNRCDDSGNNDHPVAKRIAGAFPFEPPQQLFSVLFHIIKNFTSHI